LCEDLRRDQLFSGCPGELSAVHQDGWGSRYLNALLWLAQNLLSVLLDVVGKTLVLNATLDLGGAGAGGLRNLVKFVVVKPDSRQVG
jgi:hypothetical protein